MKTMSMKSQKLKRSLKCAQELNEVSTATEFSVDAANRTPHHLGGRLKKEDLIIIVLTSSAANKALSVTRHPS